MRRFTTCCVSAALPILCGSLIQAADTASYATPPPDKEKFHLYLLIGQSNMAGRGKVDADDKTPNPRVLTLTKDGKWAPTVDPIHFDKPGVGVGPGRTFGLAVADKYPDVVVGLIPCAQGGSPIASWEPGKDFTQTKSKPYDDAIRRARLAMDSGTLKGVLWHQGESDCNANDAKLYGDRLKSLIQRVRTDLAAPNVPFLIGQMGRFTAKPWTKDAEAVDAAQQAVAKETPHSGFVSSDGLKSGGDNLHFDAESARELGKRYAELYFKLRGNTSPADVK